jgi:hypothetical protein
MNATVVTGNPMDVFFTYVRLSQFSDILNTLIRAEDLLPIQRTERRGLLEPMERVRQNLINTAHQMRLDRFDVVPGVVVWGIATIHEQNEIIYNEAVRIMRLLFQNTHPELELYTNNVRDQEKINIICELNNWILHNKPDIVNDDSGDEDDDDSGDDDYDDDEDDDDYDDNEIITHERLHPMDYGTHMSSQDNPSNTGSEAAGGKPRKSRKSRKTRKTRKSRKARKSRK